MRKRSWLLLTLGLAAPLTGCGKSQPQEHAVPHVKTADRQNSVEQALEMHARRAKREIDDITDEAESAVRKAKAKTDAETRKRAEEMSEFAAEVAEEAKDRAVDIPEVVDRVLERHSRRWKQALHKATQADDAETETQTTEAEPEE
jgi:hypothetical protein